MTFRWSWLLPALFIVPLVLAAYVWSERRKRKYAVPFASLTLIRDAIPRHTRWRRHVPVALMLLALAALLLAAARPITTQRVPRSRTSIILTLDVSRSMCSTDVAPNRLAAAQRAADALVRQERGGVRIGVVAFSGAAQVLVPPTTDTGRVRQAIQGLTTGRATGIGNAILAGIDAISEVNPDVAPSTIDLGQDPSGDAPTTSEFTPDIIVLLTDGANNIGVDPMVAAAQAADRKVRVYTIGFGTDDPGPPVCTADQLGSDPLAGQFGGPGGLGAAPAGGLGSGSRFLASDQQALQKIADATGGTAYRAASADQLLRVFHKLPTRVVVQTETRELTAAFVAVGIVLTVLALALSMRWNRFV